MVEGIIQDVAVEPAPAPKLKRTPKAATPKETTDVTPSADLRITTSGGSVVFLKAGEKRTLNNRLLHLARGVAAEAQVDLKES
jgi:hypothetical protein